MSLMSLKTKNNLTALALFGGGSAVIVSGLAGVVPSLGALLPSSPMVRAAVVGVLGGALTYVGFGVHKHGQSSSRRKMLAGLGAAGAAAMTYAIPSLQAAGVPGFAGLRGATLAFQSPSMFTRTLDGFNSLRGANVMMQPVAGFMR